MKKYYVLTEKCFIGEKGDVVVIEDDGDSYCWYNITKNIGGGPVYVSEWNYLKEVKE